MRDVTLSAEERGALIRRLNWATRSGGATLTLFTAFTAGLSAWMWQSGASREELIGGAVLTVAFALPAWRQQVSRPGAVRRLLGGSLRSASGRIVGLRPGGDPQGWSVQVRMRPPDGIEVEGSFWAYEQPSWIPGEPMEFLIGPDERTFFPRRLEVRADTGQLGAGRSSPRRLTVRRLAVWFVLLLICAAGLVSAHRAGAPAP